MEFFNWQMLGTYAGAVSAVTIFTEMTKTMPVIKKIPTQLWSYILSVIILIAAHIFTGQYAPADIALTLFNAGIVSLAANGSYEIIRRVENLPQGVKDDDSKG